MARSGIPAQIAQISVPSWVSADLVLCLSALGSPDDRPPATTVSIQPQPPPFPSFVLASTHETDPLYLCMTSLRIAPDCPSKFLPQHSKTIIITHNPSSTHHQSCAQGTSSSRNTPPATINERSARATSTATIPHAITAPVIRRDATHVNVIAGGEQKRISRESQLFLPLQVADVIFRWRFIRTSRVARNVVDRPEGYCDDCKKAQGRA